MGILSYIPIRIDTYSNIAGFRGKFESRKNNYYSHNFHDTHESQLASSLIVRFAAYGELIDQEAE